MNTQAEIEVISCPDERMLDHDLGTFEGFNFREAEAIYPDLTAEQVVNWNHDTRGEAEFWPAGDCPGVALLFDDQAAVSASELLKLDELLTAVGDDGLETYVRLYHLVRTEGCNLMALDAGQVEDFSGHIFTGSNFLDLRQDAAYELFELYYPTEYAVWEQSTCDGLIFDQDRFLDSPAFGTHEVTVFEVKVLVVVPQ